jgi:predicted HD superfamily hydrolase involved in NAD metabolism
MMYPERTEILRWLYERLKPKRFLHTLGVEELAVQLAWKNNQSVQLASAAALLHDCAKNMSDDELLQICSANGIDLAPNQDYPQLLHAFAAPYVAQSRFGSLPMELLDAICYHTTGRPNMTPMDKIIFSADYAEPTRKPFPGLEEARTVLLQDLDAGTLLIMQNTVDYLQKNNALIHPYTLNALQSLQQTRKEN